MAFYENPEFVTPITGHQVEVSEAEQRLVAQRFTNLYTDLLLNHPDKVDEPDGRLPGLHDQLHLELPIDTHGHWTVDLSTLTPPANETELPPADLPRKIIDVKWVQEDKNRNAFSYVLSADDVVRRYDAGDLHATQLIQEALGEDLPSLLQQNQVKTHEQVLDEFRDAARYAIEKTRADEDEGRNNQPVSFAEMEGLATMLTGPDVVAGYPPEKYQYRKIIL